MTYLLILLGVSLLVSAVGWIYFIYFFSLGYGYGVAALAITMVALFSSAITWPTALLCALLFVFGCRLGTYFSFARRRPPHTAKYCTILHCKRKSHSLSSSRCGCFAPFFMWHK